jgi:hypothetical protein
MKIFNSIQLRSNSEEICQKCAYFQNDPTLIEEAYPGLTTMSSGYASVRDRDGLCSYNQLYLSAHDSCPHFAPRTAEFNQAEIEKIAAIQ